jgi:peptidoglycan/xylan/chitin deacetylase (PgdA/CDA1 family)
VLKRENAAATFFLLGEQVESCPEVARQVAEGGFEIGNHTYSHRSLRKIAIKEAEEEIDSAQQLIIETTGVTPAIMRPPYGESNADIVKLAKERNLKMIYWTVDTEDYRLKVAKKDIVKKVMEEVCNGAIILMHDRNTKTIEATEEIIVRLRKKGYAFCSVSELLSKGKRDD